MPLSFDLPVEELPDYQGRNPKPDDHGEYWDTALEEMRQTRPEVEIVPSGFTVPYAHCEHLYFTGVGGARVHAQLLRPKAVNGKNPAVLMFHGYAGNSGDWQTKLPLVAAGFTVVAMDCRGQGGLSNDHSMVTGHTLQGHIVRGLSDALQGAPERLYYRQVFLDTASLANIVMGMDSVDETRVAATGMSQGGALTLACAALEPRIRLAFPICPFLCDYQRVWEIDLAAEAYFELADWFRRFDPRHERERDVFTQLGYIDIQHLADRVTADVTWFIGLADKVCPPSSQYAAYNKLAANKSMVNYPDYAHEAYPGAADSIFESLMRL